VKIFAGLFNVLSHDIRLQLILFVANHSLLLSQPSIRFLQIKMTSAKYLSKIRAIIPIRHSGKAILIIFLLMLISVHPAFPQKGKSYADIDRIALAIPASKEQSPQGIADYVMSNFDRPADRSRAIYAYIVNNIAYDVPNMYSTKLYNHPGELVTEALNSRKGICMHFAELYADIANRVDIPTVVVAGYTRQDGHVDRVSHAWCASRIDSDWILLDPTWGAGTIQKNRFIPAINDAFFNSPPDLLLKSHMPFDPIWQLRPQPITHHAFISGKTDKIPGDFHFTDSVNAYLQQPKTDQISASIRRTESAGVANELISEYVRFLKTDLQYRRQQIAVDAYNDAVFESNEAITLLNAFVDYRNKQFSPKREDDEIRAMIDAISTRFASARNELAKVTAPDPQTAKFVEQLRNSIDTAEGNLAEHADFVEKYIGTSKMMRKSLFYSYRWQGGR